MARQVVPILLVVLVICGAAAQNIAEEPFASAKAIALNTKVDYTYEATDAPFALNFTVSDATRELALIVDNAISVGSKARVDAYFWDQNLAGDLQIFFSFLGSQLQDVASVDWVCPRKLADGDTVYISVSPSFDAGTGSLAVYSPEKSSSVLQPGVGYQVALVPALNDAAGRSLVLPIPSPSGSQNLQIRAVVASNSPSKISPSMSNVESSSGGCILASLYANSLYQSVDWRDLAGVSFWSVALSAGPCCGADVDLPVYVNVGYCFGDENCTISGVNSGSTSSTQQNFLKQLGFETGRPSNASSSPLAPGNLILGLVALLMGLALLC